MKHLFKALSVLLLLSILLGVLAGCGETDDSTLPSDSTGSSELVDPVDYAGSVELNMNTSTLKLEVTVKSYIDGDTTHFNVPADVMPDGIFKARYLGVNTPESTGKVEEYGKAASNFTKEKLQSAESIIIESDTDSWNPDSTGSRYLVWVWYKPQGSDSYRNLNVEILQNGLAFAKSSADNTYGSVCTNAINQARAMKLHVYSGQPDPDFYYGEAVELTLKELRANIEAYNGIKVAFNGVITRDSANTVYVEAYDAATDMYNGISVYYGNGLNGMALQILSVGNEVRIVGKVQYYETGGTWQISGLEFDPMEPNSPEYIQKISEGKTAANLLTTADTFMNGKVEVEVDEELKTFDYAYMAMSTTISMENLTVKDIYVTDSGSSAGAMTLTCESEGVTVYVRTTVLRDKEGNVITSDAYLGKTIDVKGIVDYFDGEYQIKVFTPYNITVH